MKKTLVISGFPGVGKSYLFKNSEWDVLDSDSSNFSWVKDNEGNNTKERNPEFPNNYIKHIKENIGKVDVIMVSSHQDVRRALEVKKVNYILVYPHNYKDDTFKEWYIKRYYERGDDEKFIQFIRENWDDFIDSMRKEIYPIKIELCHDETLEDILEYGYCDIKTEWGSHYVANRLNNYYGCPIDCKKCDNLELKD